MIDTPKATTDFITLAHPQKIKKMKEILQLMSRKSPFFADLYKHFNAQKDIQENALDAMYSLVMNVVHQQNT